MKNFIAALTIVIVAIVHFTGGLVMNAIVIQSNLDMARNNAMRDFINTTTDRAVIKQSDLEELNLELAKTASIYDYQVEVKTRLTFKDRDEYVIGGVFSKEDSTKKNFKVKLKSGDRITLTVFKKSKTNSERMIEVLANGLSISKQRVYLSGMVR